MANVNLLINQLNIIVAAQYVRVHEDDDQKKKRPPSSRPTIHQTNFERLRSVARQVAANLAQNPKLTSDRYENIERDFKTMNDCVNGYCVNTNGTRAVLIAFNNASVEWQSLVAEWKAAEQKKNKK